MRARVLKEFTAYWNYSVTTFHEGAEVDGDLARHLVDNAPEGSVEVTEADPEAPVSEPETSSSAGDGDAGEGGTAGDNGASGDGDGGGDEPPVDGTIDDLMAWVGDDKERAARALKAEQAKDKPRSTVVKRLAAMAGSEE